MSVPEFLEWVSGREGRFELVDGEAVAMVQERLGHNLAKTAVARALEDAVRAAGLSCTVFTDGAAVQIGDGNLRGPDATVQCGGVIDLDAQIVSEPLIVVEVVSPTSGRRDTSEKLLDYFTIPSVRHYLIVALDRRAVIHHRRGDDGHIQTKLVRSGTIDLNPPGISLSADLVLATPSG